MKLKRYIQRHGGKQKIALELLKVIAEKVPSHKELMFVDLMGGGGAMSSNSTHFFKDFIYNEIDKGICDLFVAVQDDDFIKSINGRWITREEFIEIRDKENRTTQEDFILTIWSF